MGAARHDAGMGFLGEIVGAHDEAGQVGIWFVRMRCERQYVHHREWRFDHCPQADLEVLPDVEQQLADSFELLAVANLRH
jgi:hypothetical protein